MKKRFTIAFLTLFTLVGYAQDEDPIEDIYQRYSGDKFSIALNLDSDIFENFDIDIDTDDLEQSLSGTVRRMRFIRFDDYRPGLRHEKEIIEELYQLGYELAPQPKDWDDPNSQLLVFRKKGVEVSPHLIVIFNDRDERNASLIILSGAITFKSSAS